MSKIKMFMGMLFCMVMMMANAKALGNESYTYITDLHENETTTRQPTVSSSESNSTIQSFPDMKGYTSKYVVPGMKQTLTKQGTEYRLENNTFVPQGICVAGKYLLISAYDYNKICNSVIYVMDVSNNSYIMTIVLPIVKHVGGIAYDSSKSVIWVCNGKNVSYFSYNLLNTTATSVINNTGVVEKYGIDLTCFAGTKATKATSDSDPDVNASYCTYFDGMLWVGDCNEYGVSDIYAYTISSSYDLTAKYIMEAPAKTQGMAFYKSGSTVYLLISSSYGRHNPSELIVYKPSYSSPQNVSGQSYNRILKNTRVKTLDFSPLSEGVCINGSMLYVLLESGAIEYSTGYEDDDELYVMDHYLIYNVSKITS